MNLFGHKIRFPLPLNVSYICFLTHQMTLLGIYSPNQVVLYDGAIATWWNPKVLKPAICAHERVILVLFHELRTNEGNKHKNNTRVSAQTVRHESTCIILFLARHNESIIDDKNNDRSRVFLARFIFCWWRQSIADDVIITKQLWRDHVTYDI